MDEVEFNPIISPRRSILFEEKVNSFSDFPSWYNNLTIILEDVDKFYVILIPLDGESPYVATRWWLKHLSDSNEITDLILSTMAPQFQENLCNVSFLNIHNLTV